MRGTVDEGGAGAGGERLKKAVPLRSPRQVAWVDIAARPTALGNGVISEQHAVTVQPRMLLDSAITLKPKGAIVALSVLRALPSCEENLQLGDLDDVVGHGAFGYVGALA